MKAIVRTAYGPPEVLQLEDVDKPAPKNDEVLVEVQAASVNSSDWELLRGKPLWARLWGFLRPRYEILGSDIAGRVEAVGSNVERFQPGDEVFGDIFGSWGGFAEYVCAREDRLVLKPAGMTFEEAAAVPQAAVIALQGVRDKGRVQLGQTVLINGAGGGAGSFAVQIAKSLGAKVTGVDSTRKMDMMRSIGADHVIDYTQEDFTRKGQRYDLILDLAAYHSTFDYRRALGRRGIYLVVGGSMARVFQTVLLGSLMSVTGSRKMGLLAMRPNTEDLESLKELYDAGTIVSVIDRRYSLGEVREALRYLGAGQAKGKLVIILGQGADT
ncbi:MAG: NAD(P)-dependent alcohol dehydrogenase [Acidobacteriota bacterium]|nr:NAD(P)-dependent alcohol dehydrogenase [Acidobacteriota bacterium]